MSTKPLVSIIVVSFNAKDLVDQCLKSLLKLTYQPKEIIFIVNGSTDDSAVYIEENYPSVRLIRNKKNIGFGPAVNLGLKQARGELVWIYNDDAVCEKNSLEPLVEALLSKENLAACQGTIIRLPERTIESTGSFFSLTGVLYRPTAKNEEKNLTKIFSANLPLIKAKVLKEVGDFDPAYFLYFEEADLCWRIWQAGYIIEYIQESIIYHEPCSTTSKLNHDLVIYESFKNRINSNLKNLESPRLFLVLFLHLSLVCLAFLYLIFRLKFKNAKAILNAIYWNIKVLPSTLRKRKLLKQKRKVSDKEIFAKVQKPLDLKYYFSNAKEYFSQW